MTYDSRYYKCVNIILYACVFLNNVTVSSVSSIHHCNYKYEGIRVSGYILSFYWPTCKYQIHFIDMNTIYCKFNIFILL